MREFRERISCAHEWIWLHGAPNDYGCTKCPATCTRGPDGKIEDYYYPAPGSGLRDSDGEAR